MAEREFGREYSQQIGAVWHECNRLVSMRQHEHIEPHTSSLLHYNEAETILGGWKALVVDVEAIQRHITVKQRPGIFELLVYLIKASYIFVALRSPSGAICYTLASAVTL